MNPENTNQEIDQKNSVFKVTPLSKYLAMILFIAMPFIGGWIGYQYASEKVVEVERMASDNLEAETASVEDIPEIEKVDNNDGIYSPDGQILDDKDLYDQTGLPYVTTFSRKYPLYVLGGADSDTFTIYKYNESTQTYQSLIEDIFKFVEEADIETGKGGIVLWGWSSDLRYLGIRSSLYEGIVANFVYYIDTQNLDRGLIAGPSHFLSTGIDILISPDYSKILGIKNLNQIEFDTKKNLLMFDLNTQTVKNIFTLSSEGLTFQRPEFYFGGGYTNARWLNENTVEIKI